MSEQQLTQAPELTQAKKVMPKWHAFLMKADGEGKFDTIFVTRDTKVELKKFVRSQRGWDVTAIIRGHLKPLHTHVNF